VFTVAKELSCLDSKEITPFDGLKYNTHVNPASLRPGTILVVPLARGEAHYCCSLMLFFGHFGNISQGVAELANP